MLSVIMPSGFMLSVIMPSGFMLRVIMSNVVEPSTILTCFVLNIFFCFAKQAILVWLLRPRETIL